MLRISRENRLTIIIHFQIGSAGGLTKRCGSGACSRGGRGDYIRRRWARRGAEWQQR